MYNPRAFAVDQLTEIVAIVRRVGFGHLVTHSNELSATALPFVVDDDLTVMRAHIARANPQWRDIEGTHAMLIVPGPDAYVSPQWYPSKAEHGRVVPTWNYELVHLRGTIEIHDEAEWKLRLVNDLTDQHETEIGADGGGRPWRVSDAPEQFVAGQLNAIVGVQLNITGVEAKRKLSQNKTDSDRLGAATGLAASDDHRAQEVAAVMTRDRSVDTS